MKVCTIEHDEIVEVVVEGNVLQENVSYLGDQLYNLIDDGKVKVILNMANTDYISSLCLAVLIDVKSKLTNLQGDLKIAVVNRLVRNLMEITNLIRKIEIFDSVEMAIKSFKK